jgi:hypothetical protein
MPVYFAALPRPAINPGADCCFHGLFSGGGSVSLGTARQNPHPSFARKVSSAPLPAPPRMRKIVGPGKMPSPPSSVAAALRSRVPTGANASAPLNDTPRQMVQRITQAPPPRRTNPWPYWPVFRLRFEPFTLGPLTLAAVAFGCLLLALAVFALPFAGPAFLGSAAFGPAMDSAVSFISTRWGGAGKAGLRSGRPFLPREDRLRAAASMQRRPAAHHPFKPLRLPRRPCPRPRPP